MREIHAKHYKEGAKFERPEGIVEVAVCRDSGMLPTKFCRTEPRGSRIYTEFFAEGTQPTKKCEHHEEKEVCKVSGLLPGPNCDASDLIKKSFLKKDNRLRAADLKYTAPTKKCTTCKSQETKDKDSAEKVTKLIQALPNIGSITLEHKAQVMAANTAYNNLNSKAQGFISPDNKSKLRHAVEKIEELEEEEEEPVDPEEPEDPVDPPTP